VPKTVLLIDDEQGFLEPLADALEYEGHRVLKARSASEGLALLKAERIDLVTIDIMLDPGPELAGSVDEHNAGLFLCRYVQKNYPKMDAFCISVVTDVGLIRQIEACGVRFLRKGETPLRTVLNMLRSRLTGLAYSSEREKRRKDDAGVGD